MNKFTKAQVLSLFLGSSSAAVMDVLNGPTLDGTTPADQTLLAEHAQGSCTELGACEAQGQECARIQYGNDVENLTNTDTCVAEWACGAIGRESGTAFSVNCVTAVENAGDLVYPTSVDALQYITDVTAWLVDLDSSADPFDSQDNFIISPRFNYQDGWYIMDGDGKYVEYDKPTNLGCSLDLQCTAGFDTGCCANYPDSNNRKCMERSNHGTPMTIGPQQFTPMCITGDANGPGEEQEPENAQDVIAANALSEATEQLSTYWDNLKTDAKSADKYDDMTEEEKAQWDADWATKVEEYEALVTELKTTIGYDEEACDDSCKAIFEAELLSWQQSVYEICKVDEKSVQCQSANDIKKDEEQARATDGFYNMEEADRTTFTEGRAEAIAQLESQLTAALISADQPSEGEVGSSCAENECTTETHCCGTATPPEGAFSSDPIEKICNEKDSETYTNVIGENYTFECAEGAMKLLSSIAAASLAAYYM